MTLPEQRLCQAVIINAIFDSINNEEDDLLFSGKSKYYTQYFNLLCTVAGMDSQYVREKIKKQHIRSKAKVVMNTYRITRGVDNQKEFGDFNDTFLY